MYLFSLISKHSLSLVHSYVQINTVIMDTLGKNQSQTASIAKDSKVV